MRISKKSKLALLMGVGFSIGLVFPAQASEFPAFSGSIVTEIQNDFAYDSDDPAAEVNTLFTTIEVGAALSLTEKLAIETALVFEPVQSTDPGDDTVFENEGLFAEELKIAYTDDLFALQAGKFNPSFGMAWDAAPGIYGVDFAEDYELTERLGVGGSLFFGSAQTGQHTLSANAFFADTSFLSESTITQRGQTKKDDGGISNTEDLGSYSVTLDTENTFGVESLNTHLGYRNQSEGDVDVGLDREQGFAIGFDYTAPVSNAVEANVIGEWVGIHDSAGTADDVTYLTGGVTFTINENWNVAGSVTTRNTDVSGGADTDDYVAQVSGGYAFDNGLTFDVAYRASEESNVDTNIVGALLAYELEF